MQQNSLNYGPYCIPHAITCISQNISILLVNDGLSTVAEHPYFDDISPRNVTTVVDETVTLKCRVKNKGNRTVRITYLINKLIMHMQRGSDSCQQIFLYCNRICTNFYRCHGCENGICIF